MPKVSVIIPVYNGSRTIERCVNSLKAQTLKQCEFIFVDDCSSDDTIEKLNSLTRNDSRFVIHKTDQNRGPGEARKQGICIAKGKYIMFLDADDTFLPCACKTAFNTIYKKNVDIALFGSLPQETGAYSPKELKALVAYYKIDDKIKGIYNGKDDCRKLYFTENGFGFNTCLCKKIFSKELLLKTVNQLHFDKCMGFGEDLYHLIVIMSKATSLYANNQKIIHNYYIGDGVTQIKQNSTTLKKYQRVITSACTFNAIKEFVESSDLGTKEQAIALMYAKRELLSNTKKILWCLSDTDLVIGITMLKEAWGNDYLLDLPLIDNSERFDKFIFRNSNTPESIKKDISNILPTLLVNITQKLKKEAESYKKSFSYRLGNMIIAPFYWLYSLFHK